MLQARLDGGGARARAQRPLRALFQTPELGAFTGLVARAVLAESGSDLSELEALSETEVRALLHQEAGGSML